MSKYYKGYKYHFIREMNIHKKIKKSIQEDFFVQEKDKEEVSMYKYVNVSFAGYKGHPIFQDSFKTLSQHFFFP